MSDFTEKRVSRRTIAKGAAWSVPVVAVAAAAPQAVASPANASLAWTDTESGLLSLQLLDGTGVVAAQVAITLPDEFTLTNGPGPIDGPATTTITVGRPSGLNLSVGRARGFGVYKYDGVVTPSSARTVSYQSGVLGEYGFPKTTFTTTGPVSVDSNGQLVVPVEFGLAGKSDIASVSALASFPVGLTVAVGGETLSASSSISVPVGAGIL